MTTINAMTAQDLRYYGEPLAARHPDVSARSAVVGTYHWSLDLYHGPALIVGDCACYDDYRDLDLMDPRRRLAVFAGLPDGAILLHVRPASFTAEGI